METPSLPTDMLTASNVVDETDIRSSEGLNSSLEDYEGDSESDSEVILQPGINKNNPAANFALAPRNDTPPMRNDRPETSVVINCDSNVEKNARGNAVIPWIPKMNLLELAYRLKQAEYRVFGPGGGQSTKPPVPHGTGSIAENVADATQSISSQKSTSSVRGFPSPQKTNGMENNFYSSGAQSRNPQFAASHYVSAPQSNLSTNAVAAHNNFRDDFQDQAVDRMQSYQNQGAIDRNKDVDSEMRSFDASSFGKRESYGGLDSAYNLPDSVENAAKYFAAESTGGGSSSSALLDSRRRHQCSFCNYRSDTRSHVRRHELSIHFHGATARHRGSRDFRGDASPVNFSRPPYSMYAPVAAPPPADGGLLRSDLRRHKCDLCTYSTDSVSHLKRHQCSVHGKEKPFQCSVCLREFSRSEKLKDHFASYHPGLPFDLKSMRKAIAAPTVSTPVKVAPASITPSLIAPVSIKIEDDCGGAMSISNEGGQDASFSEMQQEGSGGGEDSNADADLLELVNASVAAKGAGAKPFGCIQCQYAARDVWHLRRHIADVHLKRRNHRCKVCRYATGRQDRLIMHMRDHGEMFCLNCDYSTAQLASYRAHMQNCQAGGGARTGVTYWGEWSSHLASEVGQFSEQERTCRLCNVIFAQQCDLETHVYLVHIDTSTVDGMLSCRACGLKTHSETQMEEHLVSHAPNSYACLTRGCNFRSIYARTLELHQKYYHNPGDETNAGASSSSGGNSSLPASCALESSYSGAIPVQVGATSTTTSLSPVAIMHGVGQFSCPMCTDRPPFKYRRSFEKHLSQHSANVQVCPLCVESFMSRGDLQTHMLIAHGASVV